MRNFIIWFILLPAAIGYVVYRNAFDTYSEADAAELTKASDFLLWQIEKTEVTQDFCQTDGYKLERMPNIFREMNREGIEHSENYINSLSRMERYAFHKAVKQAAAELRPQILQNLYNSYDETKRLYAINNQTLTISDFCRYLDEHAEEMLTDAKAKRFK